VSKAGRLIDSLVRPVAVAARPSGTPEPRADGLPWEQWASLWVVIVPQCASRFPAGGAGRSDIGVVMFGEYSGRALIRPGSRLRVQEAVEQCDVKVMKALEAEALRPWSGAL